MAPVFEQILWIRFATFSFIFPLFQYYNWLRLNRSSGHLETISHLCNAQVAEVEKAEKEKMKAKVNKILSHNISCFINRQLIYNFPEELFADAGLQNYPFLDIQTWIMNL